MWCPWPKSWYYRRGHTNASESHLWYDMSNDFTRSFRVSVHGSVLSWVTLWRNYWTLRGKFAGYRYPCPHKVWTEQNAEQTIETPSHPRDITVLSKSDKVWFSQDLSLSLARITRKYPLLNVAVDKAFITWILIGWWLYRQPTRSQVWKFVSSLPEAQIDKDSFCVN